MFFHVHDRSVLSYPPFWVTNLTEKSIEIKIKTNHEYRKFDVLNNNIRFPNTFIYPITPDFALYIIAAVFKLSKTM